MRSISSHTVSFLVLEDVHECHHFRSCDACSSELRSVDVFSFVHCKCDVFWRRQTTLSLYLKREKIHLVHFVYRIFNSFALWKPTWLYRLQKKCLKTICVVRQVDVFPSVFIVNWAYFEGAKLLYLHIQRGKKIHLVHFVYRIFNSFALWKPTWLYRL